ncbi:MAG: HDOD domain-containing protein [Betaproteobacteria bacterium]|nr:HDOD domain-containing protein [Betaproteobacteria bacterium]
MSKPSASMPNPAQVASRLRADAVQLPMLPSVLLRLSRLAPDQPSYFDDVRAIVHADPGIAVKLLRLANSAGGGALNTTPSIDMALIRVGARSAVELMLADQALQMFPARQQWQRDLWVHSILAAHYMRRMAPMVIDAGIDPEQAYLAGLLHDVGRFLMFTLLPEAFEVTELAECEAGQDLLALELQTCGCTHTHLAHLAMTRWGMAESLALAARDHHRDEPGRDDCPSDAQAGALVSLLRDVDWLACRVARDGPGWLEQSPAQFEALAAPNMRSRYRGDAAHRLSRLRSATLEARSVLRATGMEDPVWGAEAPPADASASAASATARGAPA